MKRFYISLAILFLLSITLNGGVGTKKNFKLIDTWDFGDDFLAGAAHSFVDDEGRLVGLLGSGDEIASTITRQKRTVFASYGQGPSELSTVYCMCQFKNNPAFLEIPSLGKVKVFTKKNGSYVFEETKWFPSGKKMQEIRNCLFFDNKWFFSGLGYMDTMKKPGSPGYKVFFLSVFDDEGKTLKRLLFREDKESNFDSNLATFLASYEGDVLYAIANQLKISVICPKELKVKKTVQLEVPSFYKAMPPEFYAYKDYRGKLNQLRKDLEYWAMSYSSINAMLVEGDKLVIQVRTCNTKLKTFALLFYNAGTFKLEQTIFTDDLLLAGRNGHYYFFANGNPRYDDAADSVIIHIYSFE